MPALFTQPQREFAAAVGDLGHCNPFLPERIAHEKRALGGDFDQRDSDWNVHARPLSSAADDPANVITILRRATELLDGARRKLSSNGAGSDQDMRLYEELVLFVLYHRYREGFDRAIYDGLHRLGNRRGTVWGSFTEDWEHYCRAGTCEMAMVGEAAHLFACFFQIRRAFGNIYTMIIGGSRPAVELRAGVWQSIFSHDMRRYRRVLFDRMADYTTLVVGPTGTGKELVARAVGLSRYIPFDPKTRSFTEDFVGAFHTVNLSALSPTVIESELFGHKRGSFTGASADRTGWLEVCPPHGAVFLDEIGELDPVIQVKLLRVVQTRQFSRLGETTEREFRGKIIAATNRDLVQAMHDGRFREDFYYRLCSDVIRTPSLAERLRSDGGELASLLEHICCRLVGEQAAAELAQEAQEWIAANLGADYAWPGNVRELEQCVRGVLIRRHYQPATAAPESRDDCDDLAAQLRRGDLTAKELLARYCRVMYQLTGSYEGAAQRLGLDRRTVKSRVHALNDARHKPSDAITS